VHYKSHSHHREEHEPDGERCDRPQMSAKLAWRGKEGGVVQERRQEDHEDHLGRNLEGGQARHEADSQTSEDQEHGVWHLQRSGQLREQGGGPEQKDQGIYSVHLHPAAFAVRFPFRALPTCTLIYSHMDDVTNF
jgi:hypothetical protein